MAHNEQAYSQVLSFLGTLDVFASALRSANWVGGVLCFFNIPEFFLYRAIYNDQRR